MVSAILKFITTQKPMSLAEILKELFYDDEMPLTLLKKHHLEDTFEKSIDLIKIEIEKKPVDFGKFRDIASNVLVSVNTKLREITEPIEKRYVELLLKEVAVCLLSKITKTTNSERLLAEIYSALETTSSIKGYNFEALVALLKLNQKGSKFMTSRLSGTFYYDWNASDSDLTDMIQSLKSHGWITTVKDFRSLFTNHGNENLQIQFESTKISDLIALFEVLKSKKLITPRGCKGHFYPLKRYLVNLEKELLIKNDPKVLKMMAKRNKDNWEKMIKNASLLVLDYKINNKVKLPWRR